jgi:ankyrin repeat protein
MSFMPAKKITIVILTTAFLALLCTQVLAKDKAAEKERLKMSVNKISAMNEFMFFPKTNTHKKMSYQTFDAAGNKISVVELDNEEKEIKKIEYKYDLKNNEISFVEYDDKGNMRRKCESKYDEMTGALSGELFYNASGAPAYKRIPKLNKNGNIEELALYDKNNKFLGKSAYKYDSAGNKTETTSYDAIGNFNGRHAYSYDRNGNLVETLSYDKNNKFSGKKIFNYDKKELLTESIGYNATGAASSWRKYEYEHHQIVAIAAKPAMESVKKNEPANEPAKAPVEKNTIPPKQIENADVSQSEPRPDPAAEKNPVVTTVPVTDKKDDYLKRDYYNPPPDVTIDPIVLIGNCGFYPENTVIKLMEHNNIDVNSVNEMGQSLLMIAACSGRTQLVEELIKQGAKPDHKDFNGNSALDYAMSGKNSRIIKAIKNATVKQ